MATFRSVIVFALAFSIFLKAQSPFTIQYPPPAAPAAVPAPAKTALFEVEISPQAAMATKPTIGLVGLWSVGICNNSPASATISRTAILEAAPSLHVLPDTLAQDLMTRKAGTSKWSVVSATLKELGVVVPLGIAADGIAVKSRVTAYAALGAAVGMYLVSRATSRVPNPTPYFAELLPQAVTLGALQCSTAPYLLIADPIKQPGTISLNMTVPQLP